MTDEEREIQWKGALDQFLLTAKNCSLLLGFKGAGGSIVFAMCGFTIISRDSYQLENPQKALQMMRHNGVTNVDHLENMWAEHTLRNA